SARPNVSDGCLRRFLHHLAELSGNRRLAFTFHDRDFRAQDGAANLGPGQSCDQADLVLFVGQRVAELGYAQELGDVFPGQRYAEVLTLFHNLARHLAAEVADLPLQVAHTGFAGVRPDNLFDGVVAELNLLLAQAGGFTLLAHQELLGNLDLLQLG